MKRKDLFWMIVPCLSLLGAGTYFSQRKPKEFQIVIDEAKQLPATPREVSKGFDTKLSVKTRLTNPPKDEEAIKLFNYRQSTTLKLLHVKNGKEVEVPSTALNKYISFEPSNWTRWEHEDTYNLKLAEVPISWGKLILRMSASGEQFSYLKNRVTRKTPTVSVSVVLREAGQSIARPLQNRYRPFKLKNITYQWHYPRNYGSTCLVKIHLIAFDDSVSEASFRHTFIENYRLETEKGISPGEYQYSSSYYARDKTAEIAGWQGINVPLKQRNITLKADISINDCWPLPISVVLRKDGKNIQYTQSTP